MLLPEVDVHGVREQTLLDVSVMLSASLEGRPGTFSIIGSLLALDPTRSALQHIFDSFLCARWESLLIFSFDFLLMQPLTGFPSLMPTSSWSSLMVSSSQVSLIV